MNALPTNYKMIMATHRGSAAQRRHAVRHANTRNLIKEGKKERGREVEVLHFHFFLESKSWNH